MKILKRTAALTAGILLALSGSVSAQTTTKIPQSLFTPDRVETRIGVLEFKDGAPTKARFG